MFGTKKKLEKLQVEFEQYKYDQSNLPKYFVGQKLSDGTIITKVQKSTDAQIEKCFNFYYENKLTHYYWIYEGIRDGKLTNSFQHNKINISDFKELEKKVSEQSELIKKLQWQINNPPKYKIGQKVKGLGTLEKYDIENTEYGIIYLFRKDMGMPDILRYKYTFKNKNKTITVCE